MGVNHHLLAILPLAFPMVEAQFGTIAEMVNATINNATEVDSGTPPNYTPDECNYWISQLVSSDADSSSGLSESEFHSFLSSIENPPYIAEYFGTFQKFDYLPWVFRVVHKSLACHCEKLGMGSECCEGDYAEVLTGGLVGDDAAESSQEYRDMVCQQISYVLDKSVPSPAPTTSPSAGPTKSPSAGPTNSPVVQTNSPTTSPFIYRVTTFPPTEDKAVAEARAPPIEEPDEGLGTGAIVGIIIAILILVAALIALIAYRRKKEREQLRKFAGDQAPEEDLEAPSPDPLEELPQPQPETSPDPEPAPVEPDEDDESSAPSVWSESNAEEDTSLNEMVDDNEAPGMTVGSSLAAMGAASTVAANLMTPSPGVVKAPDSPVDGVPTGGVFS